MITPLTGEALGALLGGAVVGREPLDDDRPDRILESVTWRRPGDRGETVRRALVKLGHGPDAARERLLYTVYLRPGTDAVPLLVGGREMDPGRHALALEWVDGSPPDFESGTDVANVFHQLGQWGASWAVRLIQKGGEPFAAAHTSAPPDLTEAAAAFVARMDTVDGLARRLAAHARGCLGHRHLVTAAGGQPLEAALTGLNGNTGQLVAGIIAALPQTLDGGDLSLHNVLLDERGHAL